MHSEATSERLPGEDPEFQEKTWKVQRWLKGALFTIVLLALAGGFGGSPWLDRTAVDGDFGVTYPSIIRRQSDVEWKYTLGSNPELWFENALIDAFDIESVLPEPITKTANRGRILLRFAAGTDEVRLRLRAKKWGKIVGRTGSGEKNRPITLWSWP
jgi:hypothetical protein